MFTCSCISCIHAFNNSTSIPLYPSHLIHSTPPISLQLQVNYDAWLSEKEAEQLKKQTKMLKKKGRQTSDEDNNEYYVE